MPPCEDIHHKARIIAVLISRNETESSYSKLFEQLKTLVFEVCGFHDWSPKAVIGDGSRALTGAMRKTFGEIPRLNCYFHVKKLSETDFPKVISV